LLVHGIDVPRTFHTMSDQLERFNALMVEFFDDLSSTFDEHECLKTLHASAEKMVANNRSTPLPACAFQSVVGGIAKEEGSIPAMLEMLQNMATSMGATVDVKGEYESSDEATKRAIMNYITSLHALSSSLAEAGNIGTVKLDSMETILASMSEMDPSMAEAMTQSIMCLVPPGLKEFVDDKVMDCQKQIESGDLSTTDIVDQIKGSLGQFS